jgi:hypothetical protein
MNQFPYDLLSLISIINNIINVSIKSILISTMLNIYDTGIHNQYKSVAKKLVNSISQSKKWE